MKKISLLFTLLFVIVSISSAQEGANEKEMAKANNPLADMKAFNLQNDWTPSLSGQDGNQNTTMLRYIQPLAEGKVLVRATLPVFNGSTTDGTQYSGLGGMNLFTTYTVTKKTSSTLLGFGPMVTTPNLTKGDMTVSGVDIENPFEDTPWSLGGAMVLFIGGNPQFQSGALVTYEHSLNAEEGQDKSMAVIQPFLMFQLGKGSYIRSSAPAQLDFENDRYYVPVGLGMGKIMKLGNAMLNFYVEPQFTAYSNYEGAPNFKLSTGVNVSLFNKKK